MKTFSLQVTILDSTEKLLHVVKRLWQEIDDKDRDFVVEYNSGSNTMNQQMKLMRQPTFGTYLRIYIQLQDKISLGQDVRLYLTFFKTTRRNN